MPTHIISLRRRRRWKRCTFFLQQSGESIVRLGPWQWKLAAMEFIIVRDSCTGREYDRVWNRLVLDMPIFYCHYNTIGNTYPPMKLERALSPVTIAKDSVPIKSATPSNRVVLLTPSLTL